MQRLLPMALLALLACPATALAAPSSKALPPAPAEILSAAPKNATLLSFASSGDQPNADAVAVFETQPDKDSVKYRTLVFFGKKDGQFIPDFASDKIIACSKCSQFHDDQFYPSHVKVTPGHVHIDQFDAGEKPSQTFLDFVRKADGWHVFIARRETVVAGNGPTKVENLPLPASGLARDFDAKWSVPVFINTLLINHKNGKFSFLHGHTSIDDMWQSQRGDCNKTDCTILVQQQDGCIALVRDASSRYFGAGTPDPKGEKAPVSKAMSECEKAGGKQCEEIRTDCSTGIL